MEEISYRFRLCPGCRKYIEKSKYYKQKCLFCNEKDLHCQFICTDCAIDQTIANDRHKAGLYPEIGN